MRHRWHSVWLVVGMLGCVGRGPRGSADADADADADTDTDADADTDTDADADTDTDADTDGDADTDTDSDADNDADADADADADPDDRDADGHRALGAGGDDCDDDDPAIHPGTPDASWLRGERIAEDEIGWTASLALDDEGVAHAAYIKMELLFGGGDAVDALRYARRDGPEDWSIETIEEWSSSPSLAIDPDGTVQIVYMTSAGLRHADNRDGSWHLETVDADAAIGFRPSLAIAPDGALHVAYVEATGHTLRHAALADRWEIDTVDPDLYFGDTSRPPAIAVSPSGVVHVGYAGDVGVWHAELGDGGWSRESVDDQPFGVFVTASYVVLALHGETPHLMYATFGSPFNHASRSNAEWSVESIPSDLQADTLFARLAVSAAGALFLAYQVNGTGVGLLTNDTADGSWLRENIAAYPADSGFGLALDADGRAGHLLYGGVTFDGSPLTTYQSFAPPNGADDDCDGNVW